GPHRRAPRARLTGGHRGALRRLVPFRRRAARTGKAARRGGPRRSTRAARDDREAPARRGPSLGGLRPALGRHLVEPGPDPVESRRTAVPKGGRPGSPRFRLGRGWPSMIFRPSGLRVAASLAAEARGVPGGPECGGVRLGLARPSPRPLARWLRAPRADVLSPAVRALARAVLLSALAPLRRLRLGG